MDPSYTLIGPTFRQTSKQVRYSDTRLCLTFRQTSKQVRLSDRRQIGSYIQIHVERGQTFRQVPNWVYIQTDVEIGQTFRQVPNWVLLLDSRRSRSYIQADAKLGLTFRQTSKQVRYSERCRNRSDIQTDTKLGLTSRQTSKQARQSDRRQIGSYFQTDVELDHAFRHTSEWVIHVYSIYTVYKSHDVYSRCFRVDLGHLERRGVQRVPAKSYCIASLFYRPLLHFYIAHIASVCGVQQLYAARV